MIVPATVRLPRYGDDLLGSDRTADGASGAAGKGDHDRSDEDDATVAGALNDEGQPVVDGIERHKEAGAGEGSDEAGHGEGALRPAPLAGRRAGGDVRVE